MRYVPFLTLTTLFLLMTCPVRAQLPSVSSCQQSGITLRIDDRHGQYDGMSQGGTTLMLQNTGAGACLLPQLPALSFSDAEHHPVMAERRPVPGMHPGPVLPPVTVAAGAELQTELHWVSGDVFDGGHCIRPAFVSLELDGGTLTVPFDHQMCAAKGQNGYYSQSMIGGP
ncbi:DUF4232 domain-containing protein [Enterobacter ludwigii]|uniref:DUF4232 domain-containing protein n=1 Tax=Enterobacteriaceae TaxID=543 RepID=UPI00242F399B|nr:DUF4232 domain-containing protein [Enterobacter ludwigii]WGA03921.1 DUF4232 domain-containing protein [Enterobacter ludwigii]